MQTIPPPPPPGQVTQARPGLGSRYPSKPLRVSLPGLVSVLSLLKTSQALTFGSQSLTSPIKDYDSVKKKKKKSPHKVHYLMSFERRYHIRYNSHSHRDATAIKGKNFVTRDSRIKKSTVAKGNSKNTISMSNKKKKIKPPMKSRNENKRHRQPSQIIAANRSRHHSHHQPACLPLSYTLPPPHPPCQSKGPAGIKINISLPHHIHQHHHHHPRPREKQSPIPRPENRWHYDYISSLPLFVPLIPNGNPIPG